MNFKCNANKIDTIPTNYNLKITTFPLDVQPLKIVWKMYQN